MRWHLFPCQIRSARGQGKAHLGSPELDKQSFFDFIIYNEDRYADNWPVKANGDIVSIDHGLSFGGKGDPYYVSEYIIKYFLKTDEGQNFARGIIERFRNLDYGSFQKEITDYIGEAEAGFLIKRMKSAIQRYDDLVKQSKDASSVQMMMDYKYSTGRVEWKCHIVS